MGSIRLGCVQIPGACSVCYSPNRMSPHTLFAKVLEGAKDIRFHPCNRVIVPHSCSRAQPAHWPVSGNREVENVIVNLADTSPAWNLCFRAVVCNKAIL